MVLLHLLLKNELAVQVPSVGTIVDTGAIPHKIGNTDLCMLKVLFILNFAGRLVLLIVSLLEHFKINKSP